MILLVGIFESCKSKLYTALEKLSQVFQIFDSQKKHSRVRRNACGKPKTRGKKTRPPPRTTTRRDGDLKQDRAAFWKKARKEFVQAHKAHYKERMETTKKVHSLARQIFPYLQFDNVFVPASNFQNVQGREYGKAAAFPITDGSPLDATTK